MAGEQSSGSERLSGSAWLLRWLVLLVFVAVAWSVFDLIRNLAGYRSNLVDAPLAFFLRLAQIGVGVLVGAWLGWRLLRLGAPAALEPLAGAFRLRLFAYACLLGLLVPTVLSAVGRLGVGLFVGPVFVSGTLMMLVLWVVAAIALPFSGDGPANRWVRLVDLTAFNLVAVLLLAEGTLTVLRWAVPTPILYKDATAEAKLLQFRKNWNPEWNSNGYRDEEFFAAGPRDYVVGLVADSFGVGTVSYQDNFATVAERILQERLAEDHERIAIHNFGVNAIDMPEYVYLLRMEVPRMRPSQVVLCVFVGNDIGGMNLEGQRRAESRYRLQDWLITRVAWRIQRVVRGLARFDRITPTLAEVPVEQQVQPVEPVPSAELPTFKKEMFLEVESNRLEYCNTRHPGIDQKYRGLLEALDYVKKIVGPKLLILIIPDEFQVNDALYEAALATKPDPTPYDREYPQKRLGEWCRANGVRCLDPLEILRRTERAQGRTYQLQDTHWNVLGNRVAGEALAAELLEYARGR